MEQTSFLYITTRDMAEASRIGHALVEEKLAACANILPGMQSIYHWQGKIEEAQETVLIVKTRASLVEAVTARVKALHSYETPCVAALEVTGGNEDYLAWILGETKPA